jgi:hypothetical protein
VTQHCASAMGVGEGVREGEGEGVGFGLDHSLKERGHGLEVTERQAVHPPRTEAAEGDSPKSITWLMPTDAPRSSIARAGRRFRPFLSMSRNSGSAVTILPSAALSPPPCEFDQCFAGAAGRLHGGVARRDSSATSDHGVVRSDGWRAVPVRILRLWLRIGCGVLDELLLPQRASATGVGDFQRRYAPPGGRVQRSAVDRGGKRRQAGQCSLRDVRGADQGPVAARHRDQADPRPFLRVRWRV